MPPAQRFTHQALTHLRWMYRELCRIKQQLKRYKHGYVVSPTSPTATVIRFLTTSSVAYTDTTFGVGSVQILLPVGATEYPGGSAPTTVNNILGFPAEDNVPGIAIYNQSSQLWEGIPAIAWEICEEGSY